VINRDKAGFIESQRAARAALDASAALCALLTGIENIGNAADQFGIAAPQAAQRAALEEYRAADTRTVLGGLFLDGRDQPQVRIIQG